MTVVGTEILFCTLIFFFAAVLKRLFEIKYSKFPPGPIGLPVVGYLPFLNSHPSTLGKLGKKYGKIFSVKMGSFDVVILNDAEIIRKAYRQDVFSGRPQSIVAMSITSDGISFNEGLAWDQQRRFTLKALRFLGFGKSSLESSVQAEVKQLMGYLRTHCVNKPVSLKRLLEISVLNTMWSIVASKQYAYDDPDAVYMHKICYEGFIEPPVAGAVWFLPWLAKLAPEWTGFNALLLAADNMKRIFEKLINERKKSFDPEKLQDFIDFYLLEIEKTEDLKSSFYKKVGMNSLVHVLIDLFTAGSDTTSSTLSFAILYLIHHPKVMSKLRAELTARVGKDLPTLADRPHLPYTEATLSEIYRMSSIVCGALLHSTLAKTEFEGYVLPKGTIVMSNLWEVHHDKEYWNDAFNFRPKRFLDKSGSFKKDEALMPFGTGKRICPAENLASMNFFLFLTSLVQSFDFNFDPSSPVPSMEPKNGLVLATQEYKVVLKPRL